MNKDDIIAAVIGGVGTLGMLKLLGGASASTQSNSDILVAGVSKRPGDLVTVTFYVLNDAGGANLVNGSVGLSILDSNNVVWNYNGDNTLMVYDPGNVSPAPGKVLPNISVNAGKLTGTLKMTFLLPSAIPPNSAVSIKLCVWKESNVPVVTRLYDTTWLSGYITTPPLAYNLSIGNIQVS